MVTAPEPLQRPVSGAGRKEAQLLTVMVTPEAMVRRLVLSVLASTAPKSMTVLPVTEGAQVKVLPRRGRGGAGVSSRVP